MDNRYGNVAKGQLVKGLMKVTIRLDEETFEELRKRALKNCTTFAEQVRLFVEWGLEVDEAA